MLVTLIRLCIAINVRVRNREGIQFSVSGGGLVSMWVSLVRVVAI